MLRTAGLLARPRRALTAGFAGRISPDGAALLLGGWDLTETGLPPVSPSELVWTHRERGTPPGSRPFACRPVQRRPQERHEDDHPRATRPVLLNGHRPSWAVASRRSARARSPRRHLWHRPARVPRPAAILQLSAHSGARAGGGDRRDRRE